MMPSQPAVLFVNVGSVFPLNCLAMTLRHRNHFSPNRPVLQVLYHAQACTPPRGEGDYSVVFRDLYTRIICCRMALILMPACKPCRRS